MTECARNIYLCIPVGHTGISCQNVQRSGQAQGTMIYLFGLLFFSQDGGTLKKATKIIKIIKKLLLFGIFSEFIQFWLENSGSNL